MTKPDAHVLAVRDFSFGYGQEDVLKQVSFQVEHGEFVTIIGPNGAGKSTLLKCVMRILAGGRGEINIDDRPLDSYSQRRLATIISYVPQGVKGPLPWNVREFVMMGRYPYLSALSSCSVEDRRRVDEILELTDVTRLAERPLGSLSGGEQQTVMITAALAQEADLLLLDEPGTFLDPHHQDDVNHLLHRLTAAEGKAILAVTHNINTAAMISNRVLALKDGRIVFTGNSEEMMTNEVLEMVFDKQFTFVDHPVTGRRVIVPEAVE